MEGSPSGLWRRLGKAVWEQSHRGFESLSLRQKNTRYTIEYFCIIALLQTAVRLVFRGGEVYFGFTPKYTGEGEPSP